MIFSNLFRLYRNNGSPRPLEDFTTEIFAEVLRSDIQLRLSFCKKFLDFQEPHQKIYTQRKFILEDYPHCIVDLVVEGNYEICFIENKVNSKEGHLQLERYSKVLDQYEDKRYRTKLIYCTKNTEEKKGLKKHSFNQLKWYDFSQFLRSWNTNAFVKHFLFFLNEYEMDQDLNILSKDLICLENMSKAIGMMNEYMERAKKPFESFFGKSIDHRKGNRFFDQCHNFNRFCIQRKNIIKAKGLSEVLYGFEFEGKIVVQIFISNDTEGYEKYKNSLTNKEGFSIFESEYGLRIFIEKNLGHFLNDETSDVKIVNWFKETFGKFNTLMAETKSSIPWAVHD